MNANIQTVKDMVMGILTDNEIMTSAMKERIEKGCSINYHMTSTYGLEQCEAHDIIGRDSKTSGWYIVLEGTRAKVSFFLNNDMEIARKPRNAESVYDYYFRINESYWKENF